MSYNKIDINNHKPYMEGTHSTFVSKENNCVHTAKNPSGHYVRKFRIDGDVIPKQDTKTERCDCLLVNDTHKDSYYIELKGSDLEKAIDQVDRSVLMISESLPQYKIFRRIIYHSGTTQIHNQKVVKWKSKYPNTAVIKNRTYTENIS